jgi:hypothetical protein
MRRLLLERFPALVARDAERLVLMTGSQPARKVRDAVRILAEYLDTARSGSGRTTDRSWSLRARQRTAAPLLAVIVWALRQAGK